MLLSQSASLLRPFCPFVHDSPPAGAVTIRSFTDITVGAYAFLSYISMFWVHQGRESVRFYWRVHSPFLMQVQACQHLGALSSCSLGTSTALSLQGNGSVPIPLFLPLLLWSSLPVPAASASLSGEMSVSRAAVLQLQSHSPSHLHCSGSHSVHPTFRADRLTPLCSPAPLMAEAWPLQPQHCLGCLVQGRERGHPQGLAKHGGVRSTSTFSF